MADVFISYKREERTAVERLAHELRALGLSVWFDASLSAGESFSDEIDREARSAKAILVCWSPAARGSDWVKAEALIGFTNKTLAACYVAGPDGFDPPAPFNATHAEDLRAWLAAPSASHAGWKSLLRRIGWLCGREDVESFGALDVQAPASALRAWLTRHEASPLFMTVDSLLRGRDAEDAERARLEQEARARRAQEEAERARAEAARRAAAAEARRKAEALAEQGQAEERAREAERKQRNAANRRQWLIPTSAAGLALLALLAWSSWNRDELPGAEAPLSMAETAAPVPEGADPAPLAETPPSPVETRPETAPPVETPPAPVETPPETAPPPTEGAATPPPEPARAQTPEPAPPMAAPSIALPDMVRIPGQNFEAGRHEVTFAEWDACVADGGCNGYRPSDEGWGRGRRPVINVSWNDAQAYVQWLNQRSGRRYRLLTSAEWEIAALAGTTTWYSWGEDPPVCDQNARNGANFEDCTDDRTRPVGSFRPNGFGLYDVHGNVWEWVQDAGGSTRVLRGGSWNYDLQNRRSYLRLTSYPSRRYDYSGFRLARTL
jgi:formylglycine-generating enzyme required for sulfatase activity